MSNLDIIFRGMDRIDVDPKPAEEVLLERTGAGSEFTGWVDLPVDYDRDEFTRIKEAAARIRQNSQVLVVIGIGGSYLGPEASIDFLKGRFANLKAALGKDSGEELQIYFAGNSLAPGRLAEIISLVGDRDFSVNVISKSGGTIEPAVAFRIFRKMLENKYGVEEASRRIYATTSRDSGLLKAEADRMGYETFIIPDDIGGRYSVLTAVGLLPIAAAGCDIDALMQGAADMRSELLKEEGINRASLYAAARQQMYADGKKTEIFANYDPDLAGINEWLKQLFGESEGKDGKGLFPASLNLTSDLHSMGQLVQQGERNIFETVIAVKEQDESVILPEFDNDFDKLGYLEGQSVSLINSCAIEGVMDAHIDGNVPQIRITITRKDEYTLGGLFYFFEFACGVSAYTMGVNPFDQPGVEAYKKNIKTLLARYR